MVMVNAIVYVNVERLDVPLVKLRARHLQSFRIGVKRVPSDVTELRLRIYRPSGGFFELPGNAQADATSWAVYAIGTCFPEVGKARYDLRALDYRGNATALGEGELEISPFSPAASPITPGEDVVIDTVRDAEGASHLLKAVQNADGEWTTIVE